MDDRICVPEKSGGKPGDSDSRVFCVDYKKEDRAVLLHLMAKFYEAIGEYSALKMYPGDGEMWWGVEVKLENLLGEGCQVRLMSHEGQFIGYMIYQLGPVGMMWSRAVYFEPEYRKGFYLLKMVNPLWKKHGIVKMFGETYASHDPYGPSPRKEIVSRKGDVISWIYHIRRGQNELVKRDRGCSHGKEKSVKGKS